MSLAYLIYCWKIQDMLWFIYCIITCVTRKTSFRWLVPDKLYNAVIEENKEYQFTCVVW